MNQQSNIPSGINRRSAAWLVALSCATALVIGANPAQAQAQAWKPTRPIKFVVPFPPGGGGDVIARFVGQAVEKRIGQPVVIENRPGAGGAIGSEVVFNAPPDGYTVLLGTADAQSLYPHVYTKVRFRSLEFVTVAPITRMSYVLVARPDSQASDARQFLAAAKEHEMTYGSWGAGSAANAAMVMLLGAAGVNKSVHVPYVGSAPAMQAVMASQIDAVFAPLPVAIANKGRVKLIGIGSDKRNEALPDVPTLKEQGFNVNSDFWIGILAPPKTPAHIAQALAKPFEEAMRDPEVQAKLKAQGLPLDLTPQKTYAAYVASEYERWGRVIKDAGIKVDE
jgi:tripartite-type tricarboxylate transporter receptor subunit TctC